MQLTEVAEESVCGSLEIRQSELLCRQFFDVASDAVAITNEDGIVIHVNPQVERLFGYPREELLNKQVEFLVPERFRARHGKQRRAYFDDPVPRAMASNFRGVGLRKDGTEFPIDVALTPLRTELGLFVASAIRDMTSYRRLENELRQRMSSLEDAERQTDHFLATLTHDLSSPLAAVAYCIEILRQRNIAHEIRIDAGNIALEQIKLVRHLLEDLGDLAQIRRGDLPLRMAPTDLAEVVRVAVDSARPLIEKCGVNLEVIIHPSPIRVRSDATRLVQIVTNLLANAARYTPAEGRICLSVAVVGRAALLKVKDNGIGIPKEMLTRVFDVFTRLDGAKQRYAGGMGIGLAFARRVAEIHGGTIEAFSEGEGQGSEFVLNLPLLAETQPTKARDASGACL